MHRDAVMLDWLLRVEVLATDTCSPDCYGLDVLDNKNCCLSFTVRRDKTLIQTTRDVFTNFLAVENTATYKVQITMLGMFFTEGNL